MPKDLVFELHYLGSVEYSFSLNFSRPGKQAFAAVAPTSADPGPPLSSPHPGVVLQFDQVGVRWLPQDLAPQCQERPLTRPRARELDVL